jgi:hypothetical protein
MPQWSTPAARTRAKVDEVLAAVEAAATAASGAIVASIASDKQAASGRTAKHLKLCLE